MQKKTRNLIIAVILIALALIVIAYFRGLLAITTETYVTFRTSDINYGSGSAIAYTSNCGISLTPYGRTGSGGSTADSCENSAYDVILSGLLGTGPSPPSGCQRSGNPRLVVKSSDSTIYAICQEYSGVNCGTKYYTYSSGSSYKTNVATSPNPSSGTELTCQTTVCTPEWQCTSWSNCINNQQTRTCNDIYNCGKLEGKPAETQSCTSICMEGTIQSCTALNGCSGTQTCLNNAWETCTTTLQKCSDGSCQISCPTCTPKTCVELSKQCGNWDNSCGIQIDCGTCNSGYSCDNGNCIIIPPSATCGNNIIESGEICDGTALAGKSCTYFSLINGQLKCKTDCLGYDTSLCQSPIPTTCTPDWITGEWSSCINNIQMRTVSDPNDCDLLTGKPLETQACITETIPIEPISNTPTTPIQLECTSGGRCIGTSYYLCENNKWVNKGNVIGKCNYVEPCKENEKICIGNTIYMCYNGEKRLDKVCEVGNCEEGECIKKKPITQYLLGLLILLIIGAIIYFASRRGKR